MNTSGVVNITTTLPAGLIVGFTRPERYAMNFRNASRLSVGCHCSLHCDRLRLRNLLLCKHHPCRRGDAVPGSPCLIQTMRSSCKINRTHEATFHFGLRRTELATI